MGKIIEFLKKYWKSLTTFLFTLAWFKKIIVFIKKWGLQIVNLFFLVVAYVAIPVNTWASVFVGLWLFALIAYYLFWKLFGAENLIKKDETKDTGIPVS